MPQTLPGFFMMSTLFFYLSKILWALLSPASLLLLLLVAGMLLFALKKERPAKLLLYPVGILFTLIAIFPVGRWIATPLETRFPTNPDLPENIDGIIMLGGAIDAVNSFVWDQPELGSASDRYFAFFELARTYPQATLVFTGGNGRIRDQDFKEGDIASYLFESLGLEDDRLIIERESRNTQENAINSKALVRPEPDEVWVLVTSAKHLPRSVGIFCKQGWPVIPWPVDHETTPGRQMRIEFDLAGNLYDLNNHSREWIGLLAYYVTGKTDSLIPDTCI